jgi:hypothetical protein
MGEPVERKVPQMDGDEADAIHAMQSILWPTTFDLGHDGCLPGE